MGKQSKETRKMPAEWRQKFLATLSMLMVAIVLLGTSSFAWLVLSTAPEVTGLTANVGSNGALEMALLNSETWQDLSKIPTRGGSLAKRDPKANHAWGNIVDLSYEEYGLHDFILWPSILSAYESKDSYLVNNNLLTVPTYGYDGRILDLTDNSVTGKYDGKEFVSSLMDPGYGVRAVGTANTITAQASALTFAKNNIKTYMGSANSKAAAILTEDGYGDELLVILMDRSKAYGETELNVLKGLTAAVQGSLDDIDLAIRQGMIAFVASQVEDKDAFNEIRTKITNPDNSLEALQVLLEKDYTLPDGFADWIEKFQETQNELTTASNELNILSGGTYTWADFKTPLTYIIDVDKMLIGEKYFGSVDKEQLQEELQGASEITITLAPGSGVMADIADFTGNLNASFKYFMITINFVTLTPQKPVYLVALDNIVQEMKVAGKDGEENLADTTSMQSTYGYAVDLAFRCNAIGSDLLLQTDPEQRVYDDSESGRTMGGGSYMEFSSLDETLSLDQKYQLIDAIRVSFIDHSGTILGIAKLNTSNAIVKDGKIKASLYLYSYEFKEEEDGRLSLQMLERQKTNNVITNLVQNEAKAVTAVVWLDGDIVDNTMVSAVSETSLNGILNLQFSSSAELVPGRLKELLEMTSDKSKLVASITGEKETIEAGQKLYTTTSWKAYVEAYAYAQAVFNNPGATEEQIYRAQIALAEAKSGLEVATHDALTQAIASVRELTGSTEELVSIVMYDKETDSYVTTDTYTEEAFDSKVGTIYRVDYNKNLKDEGNELKTRIYTDQSWETLAATLYDAEYINLNPYATNQQMDDAISALKTAQDAMQRSVFYLPYDYDGTIFYMAVSEETDTYGKWYDYNFTKVISDLTILKLDANAKPVSPGSIQQEYSIASNSGYVTPFVEINSEAYPELLGTEIIGMRWNLPSQFSMAITPKQTADLTELVAWANSVPEQVPIQQTPPENEGENSDPSEGAMVVEVDGEEASGAEAGDPSDGEGTGEGTGEEDPAYMPNVFYARANGLARQGQELLDMNGAAATEKAAEVIQKLALLKAEVEKSEGKDSSDDTQTEALMSSDQRIVLAAAINAAKVVDGYDNEQKTELAGLRIATIAAEEVLVNEKATEAQADVALAALNQELKTLGFSEVTAYNTLQHKIPVSYDTFEVVYTVNNPHATLVVNGGLGETEITALILTNTGAVFKVSKTVNLYSPAGGAELLAPENVPGGEMIDDIDENGKPIKRWDCVMDADESAIFTVGLLSRQQIKYNEDGSIATEIHNPGTDKESVETYVEDIVFTEEIASCTWASSDLSVLTVSQGEGAEPYKCVVHAVAPGIATVSVTVETADSNKYATSMEITVHDVQVVGDTTIEIGKEGYLTANVSDSADKVEYTFTIADGSVAQFEKVTMESNTESGSNEKIEYVRTITNYDGTCKVVSNSVGETTVHVTATLLTEVKDEKGEVINYIRHNVYTKTVDLSVIRELATGAKISVAKNMMESGDSIDVSVSLKVSGEQEHEQIKSCQWIVVDQDQAANLNQGIWPDKETKLAFLSEMEADSCKLTAQQAGTVVVGAVVTTEYGNVHYTGIPVVINRAKADTLTLHAQSERVHADEELSMTAVLSSTKSEDVEKAVGYQWDVDDTSVAMVIHAPNGSSVLKPISTGIVRVTATVTTEYQREYTVSKFIEVLPAVAESLDLKLSKDSVEVGQSVNILSVLSNSKTEYVEDIKSYNWSVDEQEIGYLTTNDKKLNTLRTTKPGTVTVTQTVETESGKTLEASAVLQVNRVKADSFEIITSDTTMRVGDTLHLDTVLKNSKSEYVENGSTYTWSIDQSDLAQLRSAGKGRHELDAIAPGKVTVTVTVTTEYNRTHTATKEINILPAVAESFNLTLSEDSVEVGQSVDILPVLSNSKTEYVENIKFYNWSVDNPEIGYLTSNSKTFNTLRTTKPGTVIVTQTVETESGKNFEASAVLQVNRVKADSFEIITPVETMHVGDTLYLDTTLKSSESKYVENGSTYTWSIDKSDLAQLRSAGKGQHELDAIAPGKVTVTATVITEYNRMYTATKEINILPAEPDEN